MYGVNESPEEEGTNIITLKTLTDSDTIDNMIAVFRTFVRGGLRLL